MRGCLALWACFEVRYRPTRSSRRAPGARRLSSLLSNHAARNLSCGRCFGSVKVKSAQTSVRRLTSAHSQETSPPQSWK